MAQDLTVIQTVGPLMQAFMKAGGADEATLASQIGQVIQNNTDALNQLAEYPAQAAYWLQLCITKKTKEAQDLARRLLNTDCDLSVFVGSQKMSLLEYACVEDNLEIFKEIENKLLSNRGRYPELFDALVRGQNFKEFFETASDNNNADFAIHLLRQDRRYCASLVGDNCPANILLTQNKFKQDDVLKIYQELELLKIPIDFRINQASYNNLIPAMARLIKAGVNLPLFNHKGEKISTFSTLSVEEIEACLKNNEFLPYMAYVGMNNLTEELIGNLIATKDDAIIYNLMSGILYTLEDNNVTADYRQLVIDAVKKHLFTIMPNPIASKIFNWFSPLDHRFAPLLAPALFQDFIEHAPRMIIVEPLTEPQYQSPISSSPSSPQAPPPMEVVYNNEGYVDTAPPAMPGVNFSKGGKLSEGATPIGYNIYLPPGEITGVVVHIYGGNSGLDNAHLPEHLINDPALKELFNRGVAVISLNLPDLLELKTEQAQMSPELYFKIHRCIDSFYKALREAPENLDPKLARLKDKKLFLYGASFGGGNAVRHAELYPESFDGYISRNGWLSTDVGAKTDLWILRTPRNYLAHLNPAQPAEMAQITKPILLMHNLDDNNVSIKVTIDFFKQMRKLAKSDLLRLYVSDLGNPVYDVQERHNKGHFVPKRPDYFSRHVDVLQRFIESGHAPIPAISEMRAYKYSKLPNKDIEFMSAKKIFVSIVLNELKKEKKSLSTTELNKLWDTYYKPLYNTIHVAEELSRDMDKSLAEYYRLDDNNLLTDEVIRNTLKSQKGTFLQYISEIYPNMVITPDFEDKLLSDPQVLQQYRKTIKSTLTSRDSSLAKFVLIALYRANPSLMPPLEQSQSLQEKTKLAKESLEKAITKRRAYYVKSWQQSAKKALELEKKATKDAMSPPKSKI